jgi:hypothetical protein
MLRRPGLSMTGSIESLTGQQQVRPARLSPIKKRTRRSKMTTAMMLEKEPVRDFIYYSVMIGNSSGITYLIYLYTNGMI